MDQHEHTCQEGLNQALIDWGEELGHIWDGRQSACWLGSKAAIKNGNYNYLLTLNSPCKMLVVLLAYYVLTLK